MKKISKLLALMLVLGLFMMLAMGSGSSEPSVSKVGSVGEDGETNQDTELQDAYYVGDILSIKGLKLVYTASGEYKDYSQYSAPKSGNKYIFLDFYAENSSDSDRGISYFDFECYADGYSADQYYGNDNTLSCSLSNGRYATGKLVFEVPKDAEDIEVEYSLSWLSDEKINFIYEGEKESGFVAEPIKTRAEEAFAKGDIVETKDLRISYLDAGNYKRDYSKPAAGNEYIYLEFEVENIDDSDHYVSTMDFDCYADGKECDAIYAEDELSATISAGRKAKGKVCFEVPKDAEIVEVEYETNMWTSNHIVFTYR